MTEPTKKKTEQDPEPVKEGKNNPLGQRVPSDRVGGSFGDMEHNQSEDMVNQVKERADRISKKNHPKDAP